MSEQHLSDSSFTDFDLAPPLLQGIAATGFSRCTPIQAKALPLALAGKDVAGQAQTGTGKTAAFLIALFHHLLTHPASERRKPTQPRALVLAPTRELAIQIHKDAESLGQFTGLTLGLAYGGTDYEKQRKRLEAGVDVLIGTPGRIIDYFKQRVFDLRAVQVMVLDEADRMFDLGFISDVRYLLRRMPPPDQRLGLLFSATLSLRVTELAYEHMNNPMLIEVQPEQVTAERVTQVMYHPGSDEKIPLLLGLMQRTQPPRAMVFVNTKRAAEEVWAYLEGNDIRAGILSGDVPQKKRQRLLAQFTSGELPVLVATDVAARGLHVPGVTHVFNFDLPQDAQDYVHRIGRTARAGASGMAVSFACEDYAFSLVDIEEYIGAKIPVAPITADLLVTPKPPASRTNTSPRPRPHGDRRSSRQRGRGRPHSRSPD